jgi:hypothetical protein
MRNKALNVLKHSIRYVIAVLASYAAAAGSLTLGLLGGKYLADHGIDNGVGLAVIISMFGVVLIPTYIVKKLLVDYW